MDMGAWLLPTLVLGPLLLAGAGLCARTVRGAVRLCAGGTAAAGLLAVFAAWRVLRGGPLFAAGGWLMLDALSAYHLFVMAVVFILSGLSAAGYFRAPAAAGRFTLPLARRFAALWCASLAAMALVLVSNNVGILWVGIEATTLVTAFLICIPASRAALEAMWKYLLICSVGVALAFTGTLLVAASAGGAGVHGTAAMLWTRLHDAAPRLDPRLLKAGFVFLLVGYGTKAGLAPMHNWLPDAHSQAPSPVSAVFSGFLLNAALYCILRFLPLVDGATGDPAWARGMLAALGLLSIFVAAAFVLRQHDVKRLLAYSSVEHLGIMALGVGLGGAGAAAALLHMLNHSVGKVVCFGCAGRLGQAYGTHDLRRIAGACAAAPLWSGGLVAGLLVLIGCAPGGIFVSEFLLFKAAIGAGAYWSAGLLLTGAGVVFVAVLRHLLPAAWGTGAPPAAGGAGNDGRAGGGDWVLVLAPLVVLVALGLFVPAPLLQAVARAAALLGGAP